MDCNPLYELVLDNIPDGVYVLNNRGDYLFVNSAYIRATGMTRSELLRCNVYDLLRRGRISVCISDIVYKEKRRVVMFQDVMAIGSPERSYRQLVISNPLFDESGQVQNIVALIKPLSTIQDYYDEASTNSIACAFVPPPTSRSELIISASPSMCNVLAIAETIASVDSSVLISGESGTGKEVLAQFIHDRGFRSGKPLVTVNCAALPDGLLETELFGYERGSFTGAVAGGKAGLFEAAEGGTLFLDEINSLPLSLQGKLLRAIETKTVQRIGSTKSRKVDFRLIAATNADLWEMVKDKLFRADLFYRLNVIPLLVPPLRERREDIIPLALHFLRHYCEKYSKRRLFTERTMRNMQEYDWPGNVRELKNFVERSVVMTATDYIEIGNIHSVAASRSRRPEQTTGEQLGVISETTREGWLAQQLNMRVSLNTYLECCEKEYLKHALRNCRSSYEAADVLQTSQSLIMRRKKKYGL